ncbi:hypothetical protein RSAG8_10372, partial [Rhizoctonia solani AG-8 WAC10335]
MVFARNNCGWLAADEENAKAAAEGRRCGKYDTDKTSRWHLGPNNTWTCAPIPLKPGR